LNNDSQNPPAKGPTPSSDLVRDVEASVLLVDDHPANLLAVEAILLPLGHRIVTARSGEEALKQLLSHDFAVILMDVQMPGLDGFQTTRIIKERERTKHIPIIFLTAISREAANIIKGYAHGAVDYLLKPFDAEVLRSKVQVFVDLYRQSEVIRRQEQLLRQRDREALEQKNERRFKHWTDSLPVSLFATRPDGSVYYGNRVWRDFTGAPASNAHFGLEFVHPEEVASARRAWQEAVERKEGFEAEYRLKRRDGTYRWHMLHGAPELDESYSVVGWLAAAMDVHDRKEAEEALREASRAKDEFLAMVSHELRTPLHAVLGWAELIKEGELSPEKLSKGIDTIERNARTQARLVEDMLDVSRIITGKIRLDLKLIDPSHTVESAVDVLRPTAQTKHIALDLRDDGAPKLILGDAARLQQIVWNLVANALKFTPAGGQVDVELKVVESSVALTVSDNGKGIATEMLGLVFDRFWQADTGARQQPGLGLGLAITRSLVELHGGNIGVSSAGVGHGATFVVRLPAARADAKESESRQTEPPPPPSGSAGAEPAALRSA
jgi:PAS domain S-box-containing protein